MSRKPRKSPRESNVAKSACQEIPARFRAPREMRVVSATVVTGREASKVLPPKRNVVPQIRLSGAWLERIGFTRGTRFLVLADVPNQILLALVDL
jgi:hypothetical protein